MVSTDGIVPGFRAKIKLSNYHRKDFKKKKFELGQAALPSIRLFFKF
jgi:hypothetical protein